MEKRTVFLVDTKKKLQVEKFLIENGITFSYDDRFHFDVRTAIATGIVVTILAILFSLIF